MSPTAVTSVEWFHINIALAARTLICLLTLMFDLLTLKLVCFIACGWATFLPILMFMRFLLSTFAEHLSDAPCNIATLTLVMALVGDTGLCAPSVYQV